MACKAALAGGEVVATGLVGAIHDHLFLAAVLHDQRRAPAGRLVPLLAPQLLPVAFVERHDEVFALVIPEHDHRVAAQGWGTPFAETVPGAHVAEVLFPEQLPLQVVAVEAERAEGHDQVLAVRHRRGGRKAVIPVMALVRQLRARRMLPKRLARRPVEREHGELLFLRWGFAHAAAAPSATTTGFRCGRRRRVGDRFGLRLSSRGNGGEDKHLVAPDHRRRSATAGQLHLPFHVLGLAPSHRRVGFRRDAVGERTAPGRPVLQGSVRR
jgi:hypothetical protein